MAVLSDADPAREAADAAFRAEWGRVVATLIRVTGDWALAEDAAAEAFASAARTWPTDGVPDRPGAWLTTVARRAALDRLRRRDAELRALRRAAHDRTVVDPTVGRWAEDEQAAEEDGPAAAASAAGDRTSTHGARTGEEGDAMTGTAEVEDDLLRLVFTCCHPALPPEARVALTLRTVTGLEVAEVAAAFGVREDAMAKRLVRARAKIAHAHIPYRVPRGPELAARLDGVLAVIYLVFTEGYAPTSGTAAVRGDLSDRALHLAGEFTRLLPREPEAHALLALLLLHDSRRAARVGADGVPIALDEQDRTLWDVERLRDGQAGLAAARAALAAGGPDARPGPYLLQAEIAACHAGAADPGERAAGDAEPGAADPGVRAAGKADPGAADLLGTPWSRVVALYDALLALAPTPHARLARAVAVGMADGPDAGLDALAALATAGSSPAADARVDPGLLAAAEADLLRRAGRPAPAADAYRRAIALTGGATRAFLERRLAGLGDVPHTADLRP